MGKDGQRMGKGWACYKKRKWGNGSARQYGMRQGLLLAGSSVPCALFLFSSSNGFCCFFLFWSLTLCLCLPKWSLCSFICKIGPWAFFCWAWPILVVFFVFVFWFMVFCGPKPIFYIFCVIKR